MLETSSSPPPSSPAASAEVRQAHSDDRWTRWATTDASRTFVSERRFQIIAAIIGAGLVAWLVLTT